MVEASATPAVDATTAWIPLPGLFAAHEIAEPGDFEVQAFPLVQRNSVVFYAVYVRERITPCAACGAQGARNAA